MSRSVAKKRTKTPAPAPPLRKRRVKPSATAPNAAAADPARAGPGAEGPCIVAIGASAGGFEPIKKLLSIAPADGSLAFVVIQHLDPTQKSLATELFAKRTQMTVTEAEDGVRVAAGHVYTVPAGQDITIQGGTLRLAAAERARGQRMPIDHFLRSLGEDQHQKAIGIILSGTGADGALGLRAIVANGGIVLVQQPNTAQFEGMPQAALATGLVTHTLAVEDMPAVLMGYARHPYAARPDQPAPTAEAQEPLLRAIVELVRAKRGYDFTGYKRTTLLRRIHRRMGLNYIERMSDYVARLRQEPREIDALFKDLLISATDFFRDPEAWQTLEAEVIRPLIAAKDDNDPIRVWVAGASTGEEAYSLAMLVLEQLDKAGKRCPLQIFATDASEDAMAVARMGIYPAGIAARVSAARLHRFFIEVDDGRHFQVSGELRGHVVFGQQNLFSDPPFSGVDLVTCRNVLIYLEPEVQRRVLLLLHFALKPDGFLFMGSAEAPGQREDLFKLVSKTSRIYRRVGTTPRDQLEFRMVQTGPRAAPAGFQPRLSAPQLTQAARLAQQIIFDRFAPAAVLVDADFEALYFSGPTDRFLVQPRGSPTHNLLSLLRESLRSRLRSAMSESAATSTSVVVRDAQVKRGRAYEPVRLTVIPTFSGEAQRLFLVVFEDETNPPTARRGIAGESTLVRQLEEELHVTRADLHATVESLATSNEQLKASNEEVVSINEELQSSNEELQSSKEELQSLNEELTTVNQQLQAKVSELETANNDLRNVLASNDVATLCLDRDLLIKWFSPAARKVLGLIASDVGRPIGVFGVPVLGETLISEARAVLARLAPVQSEVRGERERWYLRRTLPYQSTEDHVEGVIVTFTDITESKRSVDERAKQLRTFAFELTRAEENERQAIARDLHDDLGQLLSVIKLKLTKVRSGVEPPEAERILAEASELIGRGERSVRSLAVQLSPAVLYELGLVPALEWLAEEMRNSYGLSVELSDDGVAKPLSQAARAILYRAIRELLINVAKHAGAAKARLATRNAGSNLVATVSDAGAGFDPTEVAGRAQRGLGLNSMRERLSFIGGSVEITSAPGHGTRVTLTAPLQKPEQATEETVK
ncbi:MAG TPA: chemotaxis protein CheB [Burkholderiaceae bacterium]|nr:chemotaxis protein CheB [Burkholderiaceae bacterium]